MKIEDNVLISICNDDIINGTVVIPDGVTRIGDYAFYYCRNLKSIAIPDSVTSIGDYAFKNCKSLTSVTIGNSVTSIGYRAFSGCSSLTSINVSENNQTYKSIDGNLYSKDGKTLIQYAIGKTDTTFTIPNSVTSIGDYAFQSCKSLTSVTIPDGVTHIGAYAFYGCRHLIKPMEVLKINSSIRAVKGFRINSNGQLQCKDFIYEPLKEYEETKAVLCECGFHACLNGLDVFNYYVGDGVAYYEVELSGIAREIGDDSKICAKKIKLLKRLTVSEAANFRSECIS